MFVKFIFYILLSLATIKVEYYNGEDVKFNRYFYIDINDGLTKNNADTLLSYINDIKEKNIDFENESISSQNLFQHCLTYKNITFFKNVISWLIDGNITAKNIVKKEINEIKYFPMYGMSKIITAIGQFLKDEKYRSKQSEKEVIDFAATFINSNEYKLITGIKLLSRPAIFFNFTADPNKMIDTNVVVLLLITIKIKNNYDLLSSKIDNLTKDYKDRLHIYNFCKYIEMAKKSWETKTNFEIFVFIIKQFYRDEVLALAEKDITLCSPQDLSCIKYFSIWNNINRNNCSYNVSSYFCKKNWNNIYSILFSDNEVKILSFLNKF